VTTTVAKEAFLADPSSRLLFEASFRAGLLVARADVLRRARRGWDLLEIKSETTPAGGKPPKGRFGQLRQYGRVSQVPASAEFTDALLRSGRPRIHPEGLALLD
jgi:hypothetical protein